ncbi:MAG: glycosyltransferase [Beijerinckiaceae bacterium]
MVEFTNKSNSSWAEGHGLPSASAMAFIVTEDWFFASHFLPMVVAARRAGLSVKVITRVQNHRTVIEAAGAQVIEVDADRNTLGPYTILSQAVQISKILQREKIVLVHAIALRSALVATIAANLAGIKRQVIAITGLGYLGIDRSLTGRSMMATLRMLLRAGSSRNTIYVFENEDDATAFGFAANDDSRVVLIGGAGIDPAIMTAQPYPFPNPVRVAMVTRMVWSKGVDLAVNAMLEARNKGAKIELSLYGSPDRKNPKSITAEQLLSWNALEGITWHGQICDVREVWRDHHLCCVPSRGGEGLPRTMLEAAASGRAILTTDVPGCRRFIRHGIEGMIVTPDDPSALADIFIQAAAGEWDLQAMGQAARARVCDQFTTEHVIAKMESTYRDLINRPW